MKERNAIVMMNQVGGASRDFSLSLDCESSKLILAREHTRLNNSRAWRNVVCLTTVD